MMYYFIREIVNKEDGIYIKYYNAEQEFPEKPFSDIKAPALTEIYNAGGRKALDRYIIKQMANNQYHFRGQHPSLKRYKKLMDTDDYLTLCKLLNPTIAKNKVDVDIQISQLLDTLSTNCSKGYRS